MSGIVIELEREALDENVTIESLVRKAYLVAKKLRLKEFEEWLVQEQNGYKKEIPDYRTISGEIKGLNPYHGWVPVVMPGELANTISKMPIPNSLSSLWDVYNSSEDSICLNVNGKVAEWLNQHIDFIPTKYVFYSSKSELYRIMSIVRNKILDWALLLEEYGIVGYELTFSDAEKRKATETPIINNYTNNFYGEVSDIDIKQGM